MESSQPVGNRQPDESRITRGWRLTGAAWRLMRHDRTMIAIALLGAVCGTAGAAVVLTGLIGIGAWTFVVTVPAAILLFVGIALSVNHPGSGVPLIAVGVTGIVVVSALATATKQVFAVALYRFAIGVPAAGFATTDLENAFTAKKRGWLTR